MLIFTFNQKAQNKSPPHKYILSIHSSPRFRLQLIQYEGPSLSIKYLTPIKHSPPVGFISPWPYHPPWMRTNDRQTMCLKLTLKERPLGWRVKKPSTALTHTGNSPHRIKFCRAVVVVLILLSLRRLERTHVTQRFFLLETRGAHTFVAARLFYSLVLVVFYVYDLGLGFHSAPPTATWPGVSDDWRDEKDLCVCEVERVQDTMNALTERRDHIFIVCRMLKYVAPSTLLGSGRKKSNTDK